VNKTQVSDLVILAGAGAVVISALVAAGVAIWRTRLLLDGESSRLEKQLAHNRAQTEREELRHVIDETIRTVQNGMYRAVELQALVVRASREEAIDSDAFTETRAGLSDLIRRLNGFQARLAVRLPLGAPLPVAVDECRQGLGLARIYADLAWPESTKVDRDELERMLRDVESKITTFENQARLLAQSELETDFVAPVYTTAGSSSSAST
jgi:hypothetical protein